MQKQVLLVDDDAELLNTFKRILEIGGYHVKTASTGQEAANELSKNRYQLVILDIVLTDTRGDEITRDLRRRDKETNVILITGNASFMDCIDALELGIYDILLKPIAPKEILRVTNEVFLSKKHRAIENDVKQINKNKEKPREGIKIVYNKIFSSVS